MSSTFAEAAACLGNACSSLEEAARFKFASAARQSVFSVRTGTTEEAAAVHLRNLIAQLSATHGMGRSVHGKSVLGASQLAKSSSGDTLSRAAKDLPAASASQLGAVLAALEQAGRLAVAHGMDRGRVTSCRAAVAGVATSLAAAHRAMARYSDDTAAAGTVRDRVQQAREELEADREAAEAELQELEAAAASARDAVEESSAVLRARRQEAEDAASGDVESLATAARRRRDAALEESGAVGEALARATDALRDARSLLPATQGSAAVAEVSPAERDAASSKRSKRAGPTLESLLAERDALRAEAAALTSVVARSRSDGAEAEARAREERSVKAEAEADARAAAVAEAEGARLRAAAAWYGGCTGAVVKAAAEGGSERAVVLRALLDGGGECGMKELAASLTERGWSSKDVTRLVYKLASARLVKLNRQPKGMLVQAMVM